MQRESRRAVLPDPTGLWADKPREEIEGYGMGEVRRKTYPPIPIVKARSFQSLPSARGISRPT